MRSLATSAHALVATAVDYADVDRVRREAGLSYLPFVARAVVEALRNRPHLNASVGDGQLIVHRAVHLGIAVDVEEEALMVPVVHDADRLRLPALAEAIADLAARTRRRRLTTGELTGGTFTITNVGASGTLVTAPIINQPQVGDPLDRRREDAAGGHPRRGRRLGHRRAPRRQPVPFVRPPGRRRGLCRRLPGRRARPARDPRLGAEVRRRDRHRPTSCDG